MDATAKRTITKDTLAEYYTNNGTLVVNGAAIFPDDTDLSKLGAITGTGQILIGSSTAYPVTVLLTIYAKWQRILPDPPADKDRINSSLSWIQVSAKYPPSWTASIKTPASWRMPCG